MTHKEIIKKPQGPIREQTAEKEPIAIIGIGCRFPGDANDPKSFWQLLVNGVDAITEIPADRVDVAPYFHPEPGTPGKIISREGGFIANVDSFDASFFGISPREANCVDPQQRLLLEVAWEALEDAGQVPEHLKESQTGVFVGVWTNDYADKMYRLADDINLYTTTGGGRYAASGRLSYFFGFQGPSLTVDTACSSSLVGVHLACQSLREGESNLALAGGANLILEPGISIGYSRSKMLSPDGRCKFGDASANGYVRSEGVGLVVLKRLSDAIADHDRIYAVIRGSAVNNDGRSSELLVAPGIDSQIKLMREAYRNANISPAQVGYIEAHGTGTQVGDPVELRAIGSVISEGRPADRPCLIGSIKTNIGHTEAASGAAGLIKAALSLKHKAIPASLHFKEPNPKIPWSELPLVMQTKLTAWPESMHTAVAAVNSFGITGTNTHIVLSEWPEQNNETSTEETAQDIPLALSAQSSEALQNVAKSYLALLTQQDVPALSDICYTANCRRTHHAERLAVIGKSHQELAEQLSAFIQQTEDRVSKLGEQARVVFVFPGQGSQWLGMGRELLNNNRVFCETMQQCEQAFKPRVDWSLLEQLSLGEDAPGYRLNEISVIQPVLFAIQIALAAVWRSWGIEPSAVIGHSMGEVAAAYAAGALSLEDAARVICKRSQLMQRTSGQGAMAVVGLTAAEARETIRGYEDKLSIAVHNSPRSVVLSGDPNTLETVLEKLRAQDVFCRPVNVDVASHSPQMDPLQPELVQSLNGIQPRTGTIPFYSTLTQDVRDGLTLDADYWGNNLRQPVQFANTIQKLLEAEHVVFIEMSTHPILLTAIQEVSAALNKPAHGLASLRRDQPEMSTILGELGNLYRLGYQVDWNRLFPSGGRVVSLPAYPWQRERFWIEVDASENHADDSHSPSQRFNPNQASKIVKQRETSLQKLSEWLYAVQWEPAAPPETEAASNTGAWLVFCDRSGTGEALAELLGKRGERCVLVSQGKDFAQFDPDRFAMRPEQETDMQELIQTLLLQGAQSWRGIVHLWSMDTPPPIDLSTSFLEEVQIHNCGSLLHLIQQLSRAELASRPQLWIVTQGAQPVLSTERVPLAVGQAPVWGFGRVIAEEHPEFWGGLIDLESAADIHASAGLLDREIHHSQTEDQLAFRQGQRYAARLVRMHRQKPSNDRVVRWREDSTYLITGGLGGIGIELARHMVKQGARRLILMGRTQIPPRTEWNQIESESALGQKIAAIRELETLGASIHLAACDVSDESQLRAFLNTFKRETWPPIRGVLHTAGTLEDRSLLEMDVSTLRNVLLPKISGGWLLHSLLEEAETFILFSSLNSILAQPGQSNYSAANAFLDSLAHYRRQQNQPALTINWGNWQDLGLMGTSMGKRNSARMAEKGIGSFAASQGLDVFDMLLEQNPVQAIVAPIDWTALRGSRSQKRYWPFLSHVWKNASSKNPELTTGAEMQQADGFYASLLAAETEQRQGMLSEYLQSLVARILRSAPYRIVLDKPLGGFGLDSLMAVELRNQLEANLRLKLSATLVWNYPTIHQLASYLAGKLSTPLEAISLHSEETAAKEDKPKPGKLSELFTGIDDLSDDEAMQSLLKGK